MRATPENKDIIDKMHMLTGESQMTIRSFFEFLISLIVLNFKEGESTNIPFFGTITLDYSGDEVHNGVKQAIVDVDFEPDQSLLRNIGQIEDGEESDIEKLIKVRIKESLANYVQ